ncbi:DUF6712 family protein [Salmonirosea aquatica]|uniref:Uncharacterized protein n=1 Tax=Salmonirosea aquatica TaxID=2654236 RepID=A0A7C9BVM1_9BACT|nr:hypothetical protein [Cytophagaceae bacterium SJW1-29]
MLLKGIPDLIRYLGRAVMAATTDDFIAPYVELAQEGELTRALGREFVELLDTEYQNDSLSEANTRLFPYVQKTVAWYAYLHYLPFAIGNDGDNGLQEMGTESTSPVRIGVLDKRLRETERNAVASLESLLQYLESRPKTDYPAYHTSPTGQETRRSFLPSASAMSAFLPIVAGNYRLFVNLRPYIALAEQDYILPRLGQAQFDALKAKLLEGTPTAEEKALLTVIARALAHTAFGLALPHLQFEVLSSGSVRITSDFDGIYNRKTPPADAINALVATQQAESKKHLNALTAFLRRHKDDYPAYAASSAARAEPANRLPDNAQYAKVFRMK